MKTESESYDWEASDILNRLNELCQNLNMNKYLLSKKTGIPLSTISTMYLKNRYPSLPTLFKFCRALDIPVHDFFLTHPGHGDLTESERILLEKYRLLKPEGRQMLTAYLDGLLASENERGEAFHVK